MKQLVYKFQKVIASNNQERIKVLKKKRKLKPTRKKCIITQEPHDRCASNFENILAWFEILSWVGRLSKGIIQS